MALLGTTLIDDDIHPESEFENQYSETEVTEAEFPSRKASLYTYSGDADISAAKENVIYNFYNDNDELLQTENVPVVKDGTSINKVVEWYKRTTTNAQPSKTESGWYTTPPTFTGSNKYLWNYEEIEDTKGTSISSTEPVLLDESGKQIEYITEQYAVTTTTATPSESDWGTTVPTLTATNKYLWNREKIKYLNIATEEVTLLAIIGVYGDKGETGATGEQGGGYLGPLAVEPSTPKFGDYFLDTSNGIIKYYDGTNWQMDELDVSNMSYRWTAAISDCTNLASKSENFTLAANAWVSKLVTGTILANSIKTKILTASNIKAVTGVFDSIAVSGASTFEGSLTAAYYQQNQIQFQDIAFISVGYTRSGTQDAYPSTYGDRWYLSPMGCSANVKAVQHLSTGMFIIWLTDIYPLPSLSSMRLIVSSHAIEETHNSSGVHTSNFCRPVLADLSAFSGKQASDGYWDIDVATLQALSSDHYIGNKSTGTPYISLRQPLPTLRKFSDSSCNWRYNGCYPLVVATFKALSDTLVDPQGGMVLLLKGFRNTVQTSLQPGLFS